MLEPFLGFLGAGSEIGNTGTLGSELRGEDELEDEWTMRDEDCDDVLCFCCFFGEEIGRSDTKFPIITTSRWTSGALSSKLELDVMSFRRGRGMQYIGAFG